MSSTLNRPGVVNGIVVKAHTVYVPGHVKWAEPTWMRPADLRMAGDRIGEYHLANGQTVWATWNPTSQTDTDVTVWGEPDSGILVQEFGLNRCQAARVTERMLVALES